MVDRIQCQSELDLTEDFYEKLLLGAIDKRLDHKKLEANDPARDGQDTTFALPDRLKATGKAIEQRWSGDETLVASSSRWNSLRTNRSSTMPPLNESPTDDARPTPTFGERPSHAATFRPASSPSAGFGPPPRHTTFHSGIQEAEEPEPRAAQRSSTMGPKRSERSKSHWWDRHDS